MHVPPKNLLQVTIRNQVSFWTQSLQKGLMSANDTETFRDVRLTNNLILYAKRNEVGS